jgi:transposase
MEKITRIGMDTSKQIFQLHGVDTAEEPALRKKLRRSQVLPLFAKLPPTKVGLEACSGAHYWARELRALGHEVMLLPAQYVKPYVKRGKNDAADAEAICEAMSRPSMRFVPVKTAEQQAAQMLLGTRERLLRRRTQLSNAIRGYAAEFGHIIAKGLRNLGPLLARIEADTALPELARSLFRAHAEEYRELEARLCQIDAQVMAFHRNNELSRRLAQIPGVGPIGATILAIKVTDAHHFRSGRDFSAWIGLTPKDHSTAGRVRPGGITRAGDEMLRSVLVVGATAVIRQIRCGRGQASNWLLELVKRKTAKLAAVALANKTARIAWRLMVSGQNYAPNRLQAATA